VDQSDEFEVELLIEIIQIDHRNAFGIRGRSLLWGYKDRRLNFDFEKVVVELIRGFRRFFYGGH
jgi:hypothetical protein